MTDLRFYLYTILISIIAFPPATFYFFLIFRGL